MKKYPNITLVTKIIKEQLNLKESTTQREMEDTAIDSIDYLGAQVPNQSPFQNKRVMGFFRELGITDQKLISQIYQRAVKLNRESNN